MPTTVRDKKGKRRPVWRGAFLASLAVAGTVTRACRLAGVGRQTAYDFRRRDPDFAAEWKDALEDACDALELEARKRAMEGVERPVYQGGKLVGHTREYSDLLLIFLLKANRPEKYRESHKLEVTGPNGTPLEPKIENALRRAYGKAEAGKADAG